ncbi:fimbrial protein [Yersinia nurmii]|uniref:Fimbrial protein n=1 Tax=Yersinia nurmii TaxID=685706 RepID=A0AAW7K9R6_9GAMM|nr:fimbrial protein [Yersinia nurmii]MDN0088110.1 fimbrial protein [Yersinia nurmii]
MMNNRSFLLLRGHSPYPAVLAFLLTMIFTSTAYADGDCRAIWHNPPSTNMSPITVPNNAPIGTLLGSGSYEYSAKLLENEGFHVIGDFVLQPYNRTGETGLTYDGSRVYKTSWDGVGIAFRTDGKPGLLDANGPRETPIYYILSTKVEYFLVKYGEIKSGVMPAFVPYHVDYVCLRASVGRHLGHVNFPSVAINVNGCNLTTPSVLVPMGTVNSYMFKGIGSYAKEIPFTIELNCDVNTKVDLIIGDREYINNALPLSGGSNGERVATGLGIQILRNNMPFLLGTAINVLDTTSIGNVEIPLTARYYQIGEHITPGAANGVASFTMSYR